MTWKVVNISDAGTVSKFGADDLDKVNKLFAANDVDDIDVNADWTFRSGKFNWRNPANTFSYNVVAAAISATRTLNLPLITGTDTLATLGLSGQTFTEAQTISKDAQVLLTLYRTTNTAAQGGEIRFDLRDSTSAQTNYCRLRTEIVDNTDGSEDAFFRIELMKAGTITNAFKVNEVGDVLLGSNLRARFAETGLTAERTFTFPDVTAKLVGEANTATLTNKTLTTPTLTTPTINGANEGSVSKTNTDSPYTILSTDYVIRANASSGALVLNLPTAASIAGRVYKIIRTDLTDSTNFVTIEGSGSETIDGLLNWKLWQGESLVIMSDGTNWVTLMHPNPSWQGYYQLKNSTNNKRYPAGIHSCSNGGASTTSPAANTLWALPFIVGKPTKFDTISFEITTAQASQNARAGIYFDNGNWYPGALIFDTGSISTGTTGIKDTTITAGLQQFQTGLYWLTWETSATTCQIRCLPGSATNTNQMGGFSGTDWSLNAGYGYSVAHTFGALPDPYTGSATLLTTSPSNSAPIPFICLRPV